MGRDGDAAQRALRALLDLRTRALDGDLGGALQLVAHHLATAAGVRAAVIHLHRPAWDDFEAVGPRTHTGVASTGGVPAVPRAEFEAMLDLRFGRGDAQFVPGGALDPAGGPVTAPRDGTRWQPGDRLVIPIRDQGGAALGFVAVEGAEGDPRPGADDVAFLIDMADAIGTAVRGAQAAVAAARNRRALHQLFGLSTRLTSDEPVTQLLQRCCEGVRDALGFERVAIEMVDPGGTTLRTHAAVGWDRDGVPGTSDISVADKLLDPTFEIEGCYLLPYDEAIDRVGVSARRYASRKNGRGPQAWDRHWLLVPLLGAREETTGWLWADDPTDRLLPTREQLRILRTFANQAAAAAVDSTHVAQLNELARQDELTGVLNRRGLLDRLDQELDRSRRTGHAVTLALCDLDGFKAINDSFGHPAGDAALAEFATLLRTSVRSIDAVGRLGGDEFALVLVGEVDASVLLGRVNRALLADRDRLGGVRASWGLACAPEDGTTRLELTTAADLRLYADKRSR